jgi:hypothetical protein
MNKVTSGPSITYCDERDSSRAITIQQVFSIRDSRQDRLDTIAKSDQEVFDSEVAELEASAAFLEGVFQQREALTLDPKMISNSGNARHYFIQAVRQNNYPLASDIVAKQADFYRRQVEYLNAARNPVSAAPAALLQGCVDRFRTGLGAFFGKKS